MSNPVYKTSASSSTTASVHEFICLFTHDLKRKSKRWQDGRLRYHEFNRRIMVYDERGGVVGDAHISASQTLEEGEEVALDRGAAIVQVCERVSEQEVDLGNLLDKRKREVEKRRQEAAAKQQRARPQAPTEASGGSAQVPHQPPLSAIMQTPGRIGRAAIPRESPYERRQQIMQQQREQQDPPPSKKRKTSPSPPSKMGHARSLFGTQLSLSGGPVSSWSQRSQILRDRTNLRTQPPPSAENEVDDDVVTGGEATRPHKRNILLENMPSSPPENSQKHSPGDGDTSGSDRTKRKAPQIVQRPTTSRLGGLRIPRGNNEGRGSAEHHPLSTCDDGARLHAKSTRLKPPTPTAITIDSSNEEGNKPPRHTNPRLKGSLQVLQQAAVARAFDDRLKDTTGRDLNHKEVNQTLPRGRQTSQSGASSIGRSKTGSAARGSGHESGSGGKRFREEKEPESATLRNEQPRTELRIKARRKRGLLMLTEKSPVEEEVKSSAEPSNGDAPLIAETAADDFEEWYARGMTETDNCDVAEECQLDTAPHQSKSRSQQDIVQDALGGSDADDSPGAQQHSPQQTLDITGGESDHVEDARSAVTQQTQTGDPEDPAPKGESAEMPDNSSDSDAPQTRRKRRQQGATSRAPESPPSTVPDWVHDESESDDDWNGPLPAATRSKASTVKPSPKPKAVDEKQENPRPRISRINKSSKSKEIFGWKLPEDNHIVPNALAAATGRVGWDPGSTTSVQAEIGGKALRQTSQQRVDQEADGLAAVAPVTATSGQAGSGGELHEETSVKQTSQPAEAASAKEAADIGGPGSSTTMRLVNPATRGRKAASKADAAGRAPQALVPFDSAPAPAKAPEPKAAQKESASLPGFAKANGGAWSRHAQDLLGMDRPKGRNSARVR